MINGESLYTILHEEGFDPDFTEEDEEIAIICPLCEDDEPRLTINAESGAWICFRCGERGGPLQIFTVICDMEGADAMDKLREIRSDTGFTRVVAPRIETPFEGVELPPEYIPVDETSPPFVLKYLTKRKVSVSLAQEHHIGYALEGRYAYRVILPVVTDGVLYSFVARTMFKRCPECLQKLGSCTCEYEFRKVLTPTGGKPSLTLYNYEAVREAGTSGGSAVVLVEGSFDALRRHTNSLALLTSHVSPAQVTLLAALRRPVILCLDGDDAGRHGTQQSAEALVSAMIPTLVATLSEGEDPGSVEDEYYQEVLDNAKPFFL